MRGRGSSKIMSMIMITSMRKEDKEGRRLGNEERDHAVAAPLCRGAVPGRGDRAPRLQGRGDRASRLRVLIFIFLRTDVLVAPVAIERFEFMLAVLLVRRRFRFLIVRLLLLGIAIPTPGGQLLHPLG